MKDVKYIVAERIRQPASDQLWSGSNNHVRHMVRHQVKFPAGIAANNIWVGVRVLTHAQLYVSTLKKTT